jgi:hypothetical protein
MLYANSPTNEAPSYNIYKNENALDQTYIGVGSVAPGPNPFVIQTKVLTVDTSAQVYSGLPVVLADIDGVTNITGVTDNAYYYVDFNSDSTLVW